MRRFVILAVFLLPLAACSPQRASRTLTLDLPASGVTALMTHANIGEVNVTASRDNQVHVSVRLQPSGNYWWGLVSGDHSEQAIHLASLTHSLSGGKLEVTMRYPSEKDAQNVGEAWTFEVPAGIRIENQTNIGKLRVSGMAGGVSATVNIGKVDLDVTGGALDVSVNIGKIGAKAPSGGYGDIALSANIGDTHLTVDGLSVGTGQKQGTGSQMHYTGQGKAPIRLRVNTGKVTLALSAASEPKAGQRPRKAASP